MFDIEDNIDKIYDYRTKELFKEVYSSYTSENYRSVVVMLWSVVVCDLIYKLQDLQYRYSDNTAIDILSKIKDKQKNSKDANWENFLVDEIAKRTQFLSTAEQSQLKYLHEQRHLCAHPILKQDDNLLLKPTKEEVRALLINALNSVLLKTPLLSREYIDVITEDLSKRDNSFSADYSELISYFKSKYMPFLNKFQLIKLMDALWRFVFLPRTTEEKKHIIANYVLFEFLFEINQEDFLDEIKKSSNKFSFEPEEEKSKEMFYKFIIRHQKIYNLLSDDTKSLIRTTFKSVNELLPCVFLKDNDISEFFIFLKPKIEGRELKYEDERSLREKVEILYDISQEQQMAENFYDFCIDVYVNSPHFNEADLFFNAFIRKYYLSFTKKQILMLISKSVTTSNSQTYGRWQAKKDHSNIISQFINIGGTREDLINLQLDTLYKHTNWLSLFDECMQRNTDEEE